MSTGSFVNHPRLKKVLPGLLKEQRRLYALVPPRDPKAEAAEKAVRDQMDVLLVADGMQSGDLVTCDGFDIIHRERTPEDTLDRDKAEAHLLGAGVAPRAVAQFIAACLKAGQTSRFCEVRASKGAQVTR